MHADENPRESLDEEGMPDLYDQPPGIDVETESEGMMPPAEHSVATGTDRAYANTAEEERHPESVAERAAREVPEVGADDDFDEDDEDDDVDDALANAALPRHLLDPDLLDGDDIEGEEIAEVGEDEFEATGPEEGALHLASDDEIDDLDPAVEREQYLEGR